MVELSERPHSEAWPTNSPKTDADGKEYRTQQYHSDAHTQLKQSLAEEGFNPDKMKFRTIRADDIEEIMALHKEWFPIDYSESYFRTMHQKKIIPIGCFYEVSEGTEIIIGAILAKIQGENDRNEEVFAAIDRQYPKQLSWWESIK